MFEKFTNFHGILKEIIFCHNLQYLYQKVFKKYKKLYTKTSYMLFIELQKLFLYHSKKLLTPKCFNVCSLSLRYSLSLSLICY
uniref:Uncharacterized protein n=1 Tax=Octopus bimaculoides TaxID=37653 RepID=A0A0L8H522_OCTBM